MDPWRKLIFAVVVVKSNSRKSNNFNLVWIYAKEGYLINVLTSMDIASASKREISEPISLYLHAKERYESTFSPRHRFMINS